MAQGETQAQGAKKKKAPMAEEKQKGSPLQKWITTAVAVTSVIFLIALNFVRPLTQKDAVEVTEPVIRRSVKTHQHTSLDVAHPNAVTRDELRAFVSQVVRPIETGQTRMMARLEEVVRKLDELKSAQD